MAEVGQTWNAVIWLTQDSFEWQKLVGAYASQGTEREGISA